MNIAGLLVATAGVVALTLASSAAFALENPGAATAKINLPGGGYLEIVLLSGIETYRPTVTTTGDQITAYQGFVDICIDCGGPDEVAVKNILVYDPVGPLADQCPPEPGTLGACWHPGTQHIPLTKEPEHWLYHPQGVPIWTEGEGCIKLYHPLANDEPATISSGSFLVTGPLTQGGSCDF